MPKATLSEKALYVSTMFDNLHVLYHERDQLNAEAEALKQAYLAEVVKISNKQRINLEKTAITESAIEEQMR